MGAGEKQRPLEGTEDEMGLCSVPMGPSPQAPPPEHGRSHCSCLGAPTETEQPWGLGVDKWT